MVIFKNNFEKKWTLNKQIYKYIYNRKEQCALPVTTIMALWQLVNLGTRCTVTHCRIALWSHQSAQTASSERCIMQIVNVSLRDSLYIYVYQLSIAQMSSECSIEKLERNIRSDKSTQDLAWHIYYYLVSYRTTCAALIR